MGSGQSLGLGQVIQKVLGIDHGGMIAVGDGLTSGVYPEMSRSAEACVKSAITVDTISKIALRSEE